MKLEESNFSVDFIGVGAEKTASSWLFKCLAEHPQICGAVGKETIFFDTTKILGRPDRQKSDYEKYGMEFYKKYFNHCPPGSVKGEFTTTYLHDKAAARRIYENFPKVKIIIILRNPIERSFAQYVAIQDADVFKNFEEALQREPEFIRRSFYTEYVQEYLKYFPKENIFIAIYENIALNPLNFVQEIYNFLGVKRDFVPASVNKKIDTEELKILTGLVNKMNRNPLLRVLRGAARFVGMNKLLVKIGSLCVKKPVMKIETRDYLGEVFKKDIENLEKLIDRDLSRWKI